MNSLPNSPEGLQDFLVGVFPSFATIVEAEKQECAAEPTDLTFHHVMRDFAWFFAKDLDAFSEQQVARVGEFLRLVLETEGTLENATSTCFLEHAHQLGVEKKLRPWLSRRRS